MLATGNFEEKDANISEKVFSAGSQRHTERLAPRYRPRLCLWRLIKFYYLLTYLPTPASLNRACFGDCNSSFVGEVYKARGLDYNLFIALAAIAVQYSVGLV